MAASGTGRSCRSLTADLHAGCPGLLQRPAQLERMVAAALDHGLPARSILEVFMQAGLYGGFDTTDGGSMRA